MIYLRRFLESPFSIGGLFVVRKYSDITYCIWQSPSSESNRFPAGQETLDFMPLEGSLPHSQKQQQLGLAV
jgi:hypothetical protein